MSALLEAIETRVGGGELLVVLVAAAWVFREPLLEWIDRLRAARGRSR